MDLTVCLLASLPSGAEFCSRDRIHFQTQMRYMVCKTHFLGAFLSRKTENASETRARLIILAQKPRNKPRYEVEC